MKKIYWSVLIAVLLCSLTGCSNENNMLSSEENFQIVEEYTNESVFSTNNEINFATEESNNTGKLEDINKEESIDIKEGNENIISNQSTEMNQQSLQTVNSGTIEVYNYGPEVGSNACDILEINELYNLLNVLNYKTETCDGLPEYKVTFDDNEIFYINLTDKWVWKDNEEACLSDSEVTLVMSCIDNSVFGGTSEKSITEAESEKDSVEVRIHPMSGEEFTKEDIN